MGIIHHFGILFKIVNKTTMKTAPFRDLESFIILKKIKEILECYSSTSFSKIGML